MTSPLTARLIVTKDGRVLQEHTLASGGELLLGRSPQCGMVISEPSVSRMHARIYNDGDGVFMEDLGAVNGTRIDGRDVEGVVRLHEGQVIRAGQRSVEPPTLVRFTEQAVNTAVTAVVPKELFHQIREGTATNPEDPHTEDSPAATTPVRVPGPPGIGRLTPPERPAVSLEEITEGHEATREDQAGSGLQGAGWTTETVDDAPAFEAPTETSDSESPAPEEAVAPIATFAPPPAPTRLIDPPESAPSKEPAPTRLIATDTPAPPPPPPPTRLIASDESSPSHEPVVVPEPSPEALAGAESTPIPTPSAAPRAARPQPAAKGQSPPASYGSAGRARGITPRTLALSVAGLVVAVLLIVGVRSALAPPPPPEPWNDATLSSTVIAPSDLLVIQSEQIAPGYNLTIRLGQQEIPGQVRQGTLDLTVPDLLLDPGTHDQGLTVSSGERRLFSARLEYLSPPRLGALEPPSAPPGAHVRLTGVGLELVSEPTLTVADLEATILATSATSITFRVPPLGAAADAEAAVVLDVEGRPVRAPTTLTVLAVDLFPDPLALEAEPIDDRSWQISTPWGPAFVIDAPPPESSSAPYPEAVQDSLDRLQEIQRQAAVDETLRVRSKSARNGFRLEVYSEESDNTIEIGTLTTNQLRGQARVSELETTPDLLAAWQATAWNGLIELFARGKVDEEMAAGSTLFAVFASLAEHNRLAGGDGRPADHDLEALSTVERQILARAFLDPALGYELLDGPWRFDFENVFQPRQAFDVTISVDLRQRGHRLSGQATPTVRQNTVAYEVSPAAASGQITPASPPGIRLTVTFDRPVGRLELEGEIGPRTMTGTFTSSMGEGTGTWSAEPQRR